MRSASISKSSSVFMLVVFAALGVVEVIYQIEAAEPARPTTRTEPEVRSQVALPEPAALLRNYEKSLAAYSRMRGRWTLEREKSKSDEDEKLPRSTVECALFRDHDRLKLSRTTDSGNGPEKFEALRQGKQLLHVHSKGDILGWLQSSAQNDVDLLNETFLSPGFGIIDCKWIPDFMRMAKISVQAETLEGRPLYRLRGLKMDAKIELWIDPSLDYAARRVRFDKRATEADPTVRSRQFDAARFRLEKGHYVVTEATTTLTRGPQPLFSGVVVEKFVNGKRVLTNVDVPARDQDGNVIILPLWRSVWKIMLRDIDFDPRWTDRDAQFSRPIADGTSVVVQGAADSHYVWKDGRIVLNGPEPAPR
jgi:hypothetical protein